MSLGQTAKTFILSCSLILLGMPLNTSFAQSSSEERACAHVNHPAFQDEYRACLRLDIAKSAADAGVDCVDCIFNQEKANNSSGWVQALGVLAQPLAFVAATFTTAKYQNKINETWANAYESGHKQCTNRFNSYIDYNTSVGANPITANEASALMGVCNGSGYGSYAGYGGMIGSLYGGFGNPYLANGYSSGFLAGYGNPFATGGGLYGTGMYGNGMISGGMGLSGYIGLGTNTGISTSNGVNFSNTGGVTTAFGF